MAFRGGSKPRACGREALNTISSFQLSCLHLIFVFLSTVSVSGTCPARSCVRIFQTEPSIISRVYIDNHGPIFTYANSYLCRICVLLSLCDTFLPESCWQIRCQFPFEQTSLPSSFWLPPELTCQSWSPPAFALARLSKTARNMYMHALSTFQNMPWAMTRSHTFKAGQQRCIEPGAMLSAHMQIWYQSNSTLHEFA